MAKNCRRWVAACSRCVRRKTPRPLSAGLMKVHRKAEPFYQVHIDLVGPLPESFGGNVWVLTLIDSFTRWPIAVALPNKSAVTVSQAIYRHLITIHGCPRVLFSDNDPVFAGKVAKELMSRLGVVKIETTVNNPQSNGMLEVWHRWLAQQLTIQLPKHKRNWCDILDAVVFSFRVSESASTGFSPFYLLYGRHCRLPSDAAYGLQEPSSGSTDRYVNDMSEKLKNAYRDVQQTQQRMLDSRLAWANDRRHTVTYTPGQSVYIFEKEQLDAATRRQIVLDQHRRGRKRSATSVQPRRSKRLRRSDNQEQDSEPDLSDQDVERPPTAVELKALKTASKLMFRWSEGHTVVRKETDVRYIVYHAKQKKEIPIHVNRLRAVDPWEDTKPDTSQLPQKLFDDLQPFRQDPNALLSVGDLVALLMYRPDVKCGAFEVGKVLELRGPKKQELVVQWFGNYRELLQGTYRPAWRHGAHKKYKYEYTHRRPQGTEPYTNKHSAPECIDRSLVIIFGFQLTTGDRMPPDVLRQISAHPDVEWCMPPPDDQPSAY
jgi:hypothetical protein